MQTAHDALGSVATHQRGAVSRVSQDEGGDGRTPYLRDSSAARVSVDAFDNEFSASTFNDLYLDWITST